MPNGSPEREATPAASGLIVTSISPAKVNAGSADLTLTVNGTGFTGSTAIQVGTVVEQTSYVSAKQVKARVQAGQMSQGAMLPVVALDGDQTSGGGAAINLEVDNPKPAISTLYPTWVPIGSSDTTVAVVGSGFSASTTIQMNGKVRTTLYYSASQVDVVLPKADLAVGGYLTLTAVNPSPGGGSSAGVKFLVGTPAQTPWISSVQPTTFYLNTAGTITVSGSGLQKDTTVHWNGKALKTLSTGVNGWSGSYILAEVPNTLTGKVGTASVTLNTPEAMPPDSSPVTVTIMAAPAPTLSAVSPTALPIRTAVEATLTGANFTPQSVALVNGHAVPTTYTNANSLTAELPETAVAALGFASIAVRTPAPGGGTSQALQLSTYLAIANNSMEYNPANGLFYLSVPSSAGAPYGNSVVSVDPATGQLGKPIAVGSEPNQMAISSDGKVLWVGLDGAAAVRRVDLTTGKAGLQFAVGSTNIGWYNGPPRAMALVALPGSPNSVVVSSANNDINTTVAIFDNGVIRGARQSSWTGGAADALLADGSKKEIYGGAGSSYTVYTYDASGLQVRSSASNGTYTGSIGSDMQVAGGKLYTDFGSVYDVEAGALLGSFYSSANTKATGPTTTDTVLGKTFILESSPYLTSTPTQIELFDPSTYNSLGSAIPVTLVDVSPNYQTTSPTRLTRWGANGLAFRTTAGFFSLRSNLVKDLSKVDADVSVTATVSGAATTGANTTYTLVVRNAGPSAATNVVLTVATPSTGVVNAITSTAGGCVEEAPVVCDLGKINQGGVVTVSIAVRQLSPGSAKLRATASGAENDPVPANNTASAAVTVTGAMYNLPPTIAAVSPAAIRAGAGDTEITVTGTGFAAGAKVLMGNKALPTNLTDATQLTATIPASSLTGLGWQPISVSMPSPGGGISNALPLTIFQVVTVGANRMLYDPYSRKIMVSTGAGSSTVNGNSVVPLTPETVVFGKAVAVGSQPTSMALTSDGKFLYTILAGAASVARVNMGSQTLEYTASIPEAQGSSGSSTLRGIAAQPGTENSVALDLGSWAGNAIYDFNAASKTAAIRGQASGPYTGSCIAFLNANSLLSFDIDTTGSDLIKFDVTNEGINRTNGDSNGSTLYNFGCFKLNGGLAFANGGGVADPSVFPAKQLGVFSNSLGGGTFSNAFGFVPDTSLGRAFYLPASSNSSATPDLTAFSTATFMQTLDLPLGMAAIEGSTNFTVVDLIRWGQDGIAALTSSGHIYLLRGGAIVPGLLTKGTPATLSASSSPTLKKGSGNTLLTLTGANLQPGVAVTWNGNYRTTTIVDATHLTVAIPASDLAAAGKGTLVATNPGAAASGALTITVQ